MPLLSQISNRTTRNIVETLLRELKSISPYIYHVSRWNSVYLKFQDKRLGSVRIGDHSGREKYRYKWNIEIGGETRIEYHDGVKRFYFADSNIPSFISRIKQYKATIEYNEQHN